VTLKQIRDAVIAIRRKKLPDPNELSNAGSFFLNPVVTSDKITQLIKDCPAIHYYPTENDDVKLSAAWLIEQCGLKGKRFGQVGIYEHHALIIVNYGSATGNEIAQFADHISETVFQRFGIQLVAEVRYVE
jgi:UDP-N-acetylmuramate dehydrogenase